MGKMPYFFPLTAKNQWFVMIHKTLYVYEEFVRALVNGGWQKQVSMDQNWMEWTPVRTLEAVFS